MEENRSLQKTLREKYYINEKLMAEGTFVGLIGDHAANLVRLGLGSTCVVVARLVLSGEELDYDVLSLTPLSVVSLTFQNSSKKIMIRSQFQPTQVFQQCTSANQAEVWDNITSIIKEVYAPAHGDMWIITSLKSAVKPDHISHSKIEFEHSYTRPNSDYYSRYNRSFSQSHTAYTGFSESSVSIPAELHTHADDKCPRFPAVTKCNSLNFLDELKFDSFVNDVPTQFCEYNPNYLPCSWNGSGDGMVQKMEENKSNNAINQPNDIVTQDLSSASKQPGRVHKFFLRILGCCGIGIK